jgi:peroxiredoxin
MKFPSLLLVSALSVFLRAEVPASAESVSPVSVGDVAPNPIVRTLEGDSVKLNSVTGGEPMVVVFYRGGWCPYCTRHLSALQEILPEMKEAGYTLVAISPDKPEKLAETVKEKKLSYTLLCDSTLEAAKAFGLAFQVDEPTVKMLDGYGIDLIAASGETHQQLPVPAVILVNDEGIVTFVHHDPNYKTRLSSEMLLKALL